MMPRKKSPSDPTDATPSFEDTLAGLEKIVHAMEHEQLPLEELVEHYEKGSELLSRAEQTLQAARGRIDLITLRSQQPPAPPTPSSPTPNTASGAAPADDDDIRLF